MKIKDFDDVGNEESDASNRNTFFQKFRPSSAFAALKSPKEEDDLEISTIDDLLKIIQNAGNRFEAQGKSYYLNL